MIRNRYSNCISELHLWAASIAGCVPLMDWWFIGPCKLPSWHRRPRVGNPICPNRLVQRITALRTSQIILGKSALHNLGLSLLLQAPNAHDYVNAHDVASSFAIVRHHRASTHGATSCLPHALLVYSVLLLLTCMCMLSYVNKQVHDSKQWVRVLRPCLLVRFYLWINIFRIRCIDLSDVMGFMF